MINHETVIMESKRFPFEEYGSDINITQMRIQTQKFVASKKRARPIALKNLNRYKTAWFEHGHPNESKGVPLSNVITGWEISGNTLVAVKVWRHNGKTEVERRKYPLENYGKTWRCWSAVPTLGQLERTAWPDE